MDNLAILLLIVFGGAILTYLAFAINKTLGNILVFLEAIAIPAYFFTVKFTDFNFSFIGLSLGWGFNAYSWLFAMLVAVLAPLALIYSIPYMNGKENLGWFYFNFLFSVGGMFGILMSRDLVSLFFFWEIMTWSSYLLVIYNGNDVDKVGLKYMIFSALGAYAMFMGIVTVYKITGTLFIEQIFDVFPTLSLGAKVMISLLLLTGFAVKSALMPLHVWAPDAYTNAPMSFTSVFSGALSKMGIYGIGLVTIKFFIDGGLGEYGIYLAWLGAITSVLATFYAIFQDDIRKLLAYSSISQLGYIITGIGIGTKLSVFAGLFLALVHGLFKAVLFMAAGAVERQAGSTDFNELRGLIRKMPYTFFAALVSIIALAGVPPLAGFVGKWMLYESLITSGHIYLVILVFLSSTAAFLYSFRFLYGIFLGQEEKEFENVKEAPALMVIPMILVALFLVVLGTYPGIIFKPMASAMNELGFENVNWSMSVLTNDWGQSIYLQYVIGTLGVVFVLFLIVITWYGHKRTRYVTTKDIANAGEPVRPDDNYHFSVFFYQPFSRAISPVLKYQISKFYNRIATGLEDLFEFMRGIYSGNTQTYATYIVLFLTLLFLFKNLFL